jgi:membrane protein
MWEATADVNLDALKASVPGRVVMKFIADKAPTWSVVVAWQARLSIFPIILALAAVLGLVLGMAGVGTDNLVNSVLSGIPDPKAREDMAKAVLDVKTKSGIFGLVGLAGMFVSGAALFGAMEQGFAVIFKCPPRGFVRQKIVGFLMILVFAVLAGAAVASSALLPLLAALPLPISISSGPGGLVVQVLLGVLTGTVLFATIYYVVPNRKIPIHDVWPGAVLAGVLFEAVTLIFPLYLELNKGLTGYGPTFGLFFILMTYFFFLGLMTMAGAELNSVLAHVDEEDPDAPEAEGVDKKARKRAKTSGARPAGSTSAVPGAKATAVAAAAPTTAIAAPLGAILGFGLVAWVMGLIMGARQGRE